MLKQLWNDELGAVVSAEIVLIATILVIGMITGLTSLRDAVVEELADVGAAIGFLDQSYTICGVTSHSSATAPSGFLDRPDFCDPGTTNSRCLLICGGNPVAAIDGTEGRGSN